MNIANRAFFLFCFSLIQAQSVFASDTYFKGYVKSYSVYSEAVSIGGVSFIEEQFQQQTALRLMWAHESDQFQYELHYDVQPILFSGDAYQSASNNTVANNPYRIDDLDIELNTITDANQHIVTLQNLDRLNVQWQFERGDLTLGRQAIGFGSARFLNPSDVLLPFSFQTLNQEYRTGIDAIRYQIYISELASFDTGYILSMNGDQDAAYIRTKVSNAGRDWELIVMEWEDEWLASIGLQTAWGDIGFWWESGYFDSKHDGDFLRLSTGWDYAFSDDVIFMMEYHHNGQGNHSGPYPVNILSAQVSPFQSAQLGQDYLFSSVTWTASALWVVSPVVYANLNDYSTLMQLSAETSWNDDLYSQFGLFYGTGEASNSVTLIKSEYGETPLTLYASIGWYF